MGLLDKKLALVTGASRGLGRAIAVGLAEAGADVAINYRERADEAAEVKTCIEQIGRRAVALRDDVADGSEVNALLSRVEKDLGSVSILVNNAGVTRPQAIDNITEQDFDDLIRINLKSMFLVTQRVLPAIDRDVCRCRASQQGWCIA